MHALQLMAIAMTSMARSSPSLTTSLRRSSRRPRSTSRTVLFLRAFDQSYPLALYYGGPASRTYSVHMGVVAKKTTKLEVAPSYLYSMVSDLGVFPPGCMNRLSMMTSSLLLSFRGAYLANLSSVPSILTILGHSPRWVEDSFAALHMHMRHVLSLSTNRL